jgi:IS4 transposase
VDDDPISGVRDTARTGCATSAEGGTRLQIVEDLLESAAELISVRKVVMDREFDGQAMLEMLDRRGITYVVPKRMHTSERAQAKRVFERGEDRCVTDRRLHLGRNEWHETTLLYRKREDSEYDDWQQYSVFMTNGRASSALMNYGRRWEIETGYRTIKRFMAATTSKNFVLRFFYFAFACLLYSIWRVIDFLLQLALTDEYKRSPMITAQNTLTPLKKKTGIG